MDQLKYLVRRWARSPLFIVVTLLTLAIGIGANTAIFSIVNGVLLKPLPYPDAERLVGVWQTAPGVGIEDLNASPSTYFTYRAENRVFEDIAIWQGDSVSITGIAEPEQVDAIDVTDGMLGMLGAQPAAGRRFSHADDLPGAPRTAMLSYSYWQQRFAGDRSVIGRRLVIDGEAREIIGILPRTFHFMDRKPKVVLPLQLDEANAFVGNFSYRAIAKLKPGIGMAQANQDVARMLPIMMRKFRPAPGLSLAMLVQARVGPNVRPLKQDVVGDTGKVLWLLMTTVGIVLFIACANIANLLLVRAEGRQQELAVRAAIGASWLQIARQMLYESVALALLGGALGVAFAYAALKVLVVTGPADLPRLDEIAIDWQALLFALTVSLFSGLLFGLVPVFKYAGPQLGTALREGGRNSSEGRARHRTRSALVIVQVALALVLLISSGLMIRTLFALQQVQPGFTRPGEILTLRLSIPESQVREPARVLRMHNDIAQKLRAIPGVVSVGLVNSITMDGNNNNDPIFAEDHSYAEGKLPPIRRFKFISPDLFKTMGNSIVAGRDLDWNDIYQQRPVVLISENFAREYWRTPAAAIGRRIRENPSAPWRTIIGVAGNERDNGVNQPAPTIVYWPLMVTKFWDQKIMVRRYTAFAIRSSRTGSASFLSDVRQAVWSVNSSLPIADVLTVEEIYKKSMARTSFTLVMLALAGGMALLLGVIGIYGVISYAIVQRTREIGIRMALGAQQRSVRQMFVGHGLLLAVIGVACGLTAAYFEMRVMSTLLFEVSPSDPATYSAVSVFLIAAAALASYLPARRASAIDPIEALRIE